MRQQNPNDDDDLKVDLFRGSSLDTPEVMRAIKLVSRDRAQLIQQTVAMRGEEQLGSGSPSSNGAETLFEPESVSTRVEDLVLGHPNISHPAVRRNLSSRLTLLVAAAVVIATFVAVGFAAFHDLDPRSSHLAGERPTDRGVWATSDAKGLFLRLKEPAGPVNLAVPPYGGGVPSSGWDLDVRQQGAAVVAWDKRSGSLGPVDTATGKVAFLLSVPVSADEQVQLNGGTLAVLDPAKNKVWAMRVDPAREIESLRGIDPVVGNRVINFETAGVSSATPHASSLAVGVDGTIYAATTSGRTAVVHPDGQRFASARMGRLPETLQSVQVSAVGDRMVVYDPVQGLVLLPDGQQSSVRADPDGRIQDPSPAGSRVVVSSKTQLFAIPFKGGDSFPIFDGGSGKPATPQQFDGCAYAAWAGRPGVYARACGTDQGRQLALQHNGPLTAPVFRINRGTILLNDTARGTVYDLDTRREIN